jgi:MinD superfamily P-loop ATPase
MVLIVAEPSLSGISDMERILKTAQNFELKIAICVNKYDTNTKLTQSIIEFCSERKLAFAGKIPFDPMVVTALNHGKSIMDSDCPAKWAISNVFQETMRVFEQKEVRDDH